MVQVFFSAVVFNTVSRVLMLHYSNHTLLISVYGGWIKTQ